jgi:hypothetical protein
VSYDGRQVAEVGGGFMSDDGSRGQLEHYDTRGDAESALRVAISMELARREVEARNGEAAAA